MGQPIVVAEKPTARPGVWRYETNRVLTGMAHERYRHGESIVGKPAARRAGAAPVRHRVRGKRSTSTAMLVTVTLGRGQTTDGLRQIIEGLHTYYTEGVTPAIP